MAEIAQMAKEAMPYVYTALWPVLVAIVVIMAAYDWLRLPPPRAAMLGIRVLLVLVAAATFTLSLSTGSAPVISLDTYRPAVVSIRVAMFFVALATLYALGIGLHAHWRAR